VIGFDIGYLKNWSNDHYYDYDNFFALFGADFKVK